MRRKNVNNLFAFLAAAQERGFARAVAQLGGGLIGAKVAPSAYSRNASVFGS